jgi:hypothetical protein
MLLFDSFSQRSRFKKLDLFFRSLSPSAADQILDIGGECDPTNRSVQLADNYPWKNRLTVANIDVGELDRVRHTYPDIDVLHADACHLPFPDKSFDIAFSNAVIEHLYTWTNQQRMAAEIRRVACRWFVATPNRWFPFEFHARLPLVSWLPAPLMHRATRVVCYNHVSHRYVSGTRMDEVRLLTKRELETLFPESQIIPLRITFFPETLLAIGGALAAASTGAHQPVGRMIETRRIDAR